jgi:hypothetical protein
MGISVDFQPILVPVKMENDKDLTPQTRFVTNAKSCCTLPKQQIAFAPFDLLIPF